MQRSGSCKGAPASADGIRAAQAYDPRRQGAFAGNRREKRSPPSDGGDTRRGIVGCETPVKRQAVEPDAEVFMQQWECFESVGDLTGAHCKRIFRRGSARCGSERLFVSEQSDTPVRFSDRTGVSFMQLEETQYSSSLKKFIYIDYQYIIQHSMKFAQTNRTV